MRRWGGLGRWLGARPTLRRARRGRGLRWRDVARTVGVASAWHRARQELALAAQGCPVRAQGDACSGRRMHARGSPARARRPGRPRWLRTPLFEGSLGGARRSARARRAVRGPGTAFLRRTTEAGSYCPIITTVRLIDSISPAPVPCAGSGRIAPARSRAASGPAGSPAIHAVGRRPSARTTSG